MPGERCCGGLGEVVSGAARRVELQHQREGLTAHRLLDRWQLMQVSPAKMARRRLAHASMPRCRPALRSTDPSRASVSFAAAAGSGATASTARASREPRPTPRTRKAASAAGKYCLRCERSWLDSCPRLHAASCWARASTAIAWASSESAGNGRCAAASVRRMFASARPLPARLHPPCAVLPAANRRRAPAHRAEIRQEQAHDRAAASATSQAGLTEFVGT